MQYRSIDQETDPFRCDQIVQHHVSHPVTLRSRALVGRLWKRVLRWDEQFPEEFQFKWQSLTRELLSLSLLHFDLRALREGQTGNLFVFCDDSTEAYVFAAYVVQNHCA